MRVDAAELRARVVGEGGNLGLTQAARIEFALGGGLVNTDFIDNSAGVDTSDHEVNIKILLDRAVRDGEITQDDRNELLHADDRRGRRAGAAAQLRARTWRWPRPGPRRPQMLHVHARYLRQLERDSRVRRGRDAAAGGQGDRRAAVGGHRA